jgi:hypothetical protein
MSDRPTNDRAIQPAWSLLAEAPEPPTEACGSGRSTVVESIRKGSVTLHDLWLTGGALSGAVCGGIIGLILGATATVEVAPVVGALIFLASVLAGTVLLALGWVALLIAFWLFDSFLEACAACLGLRAETSDAVAALDRESPKAIYHAADPAIQERSPRR